jgi:hypothetical protein
MKQGDGARIWRPDKHHVNARTFFIFHFPFFILHLSFLIPRPATYLTNRR